MPKERIIAFVIVAVLVVLAVVSMLYLVGMEFIDSALRYAQGSLGTRP